MPTAALNIDLFCRVVDNYGDIGICWRLARQLTSEHHCNFRLIVDDLSVFRKIEPRIDENAALQWLESITVLRWTNEDLLQHYKAPAEAVIEAFGCEIPDFIIDRMKGANPAPVWIDLEYLSAEDWVETHHAIPSLHPTANIEKTLFFPGFSSKTGGLIREQNILSERSKFVQETKTQNDWRKAHDIPAKDAEIVDISMFCYPNAPIENLIENLREFSCPVRLFVPMGIAAAKLSDFPHNQGNLSIIRIPFLSQVDYDRLLWTCDFNFVRGEDSWIRALWAGKPFIWQAYPQTEGTSEVKLNAFLKRYMVGLSPNEAESLADFHAMWNLRDRESKSGPRSWCELLQSLPVYDRHAELWTKRQAEQDDCATHLTRFLRQQITKPDTESHRTLL